MAKYSFGFNNLWGGWRCYNIFILCCTNDKRL